MELTEALELLCDARRDLAHADYVKIWGKHLGDHIWRQEGNDILRIWRSGLLISQKQAFIEYLLARDFTGKFKG